MISCNTTQEELRQRDQLLEALIEHSYAHYGDQPLSQEQTEQLVFLSVEAVEAATLPQRKGVQ